MKRSNMKVQHTEGKIVHSSRNFPATRLGGAGSLECNEEKLEQLSVKLYLFFLEVFLIHWTSMCHMFCCYCKHTDMKFDSTSVLRGTKNINLIWVSNPNQCWWAFVMETMESTLDFLSVLSQSSVGLIECLVDGIAKWVFLTMATNTLRALTVSHYEEQYFITMPVTSYDQLWPAMSSISSSTQLQANQAWHSTAVLRAQGVRGWGARGIQLSELINHGPES